MTRRFQGGAFEHHLGPREGNLNNCNFKFKYPGVPRWFRRFELIGSAVHKSETRCERTTSFKRLLSQAILDVILVSYKFPHLFNSLYCITLYMAFLLFDFVKPLRVYVCLIVFEITLGLVFGSTISTNRDLTAIVTYRFCM